ncbi:hypothetical protein PIB30_066896 [Stylosanthes scabra]|uniref:Zinc knuckle CX2CX4HX4C domain-containing protein n=1 Tax=Stylosanthes scabra TaxID=79078 RepID=A0ABU6WP41_9FABA|nr:hypothetical protein [Stylosanthes scabra]
MCMQIDLCLPIVRKVLIDGVEYEFCYESLNFIYEECHLYGHSTDFCLNKKPLVEGHDPLTVETETIENEHGTLILMPWRHKLRRLSQLPTQRPLLWNTQVGRESKSSLNPLSPNVNHPVFESLIGKQLISKVVSVMLLLSRKLQKNYSGGKGKVQTLSTFFTAELASRGCCCSVRVMPPFLFFGALAIS